MRGGMNNDQCVYHVSFLLIVGDKGEGRRWREIRGDRRERLGLTVDSQAKTGKGGGEGDGKHAMDSPGGRGGCPREQTKQRMP